MLWVLYPQLRDVSKRSHAVRVPKVFDRTVHGGASHIFHTTDVQDLVGPEKWIVHGPVLILLVPQLIGPTFWPNIGDFI